MYRSGLRPGEALALMPGDVDLEAGTVAVPPRKGGRAAADRRRRHHPRAGRAPGWRGAAERGIGPDRPLFCTLAGEPLKAAYVRELLPRLARRAGHRQAGPPARAALRERGRAGRGGPARADDRPPPRRGARWAARAATGGRVSEQDVAAAVAARALGAVSRAGAAAE